LAALSFSCLGAGRAISLSLFLFISVPQAVLEFQEIS
jgi:hypothetical protein